MAAILDGSTLVLTITAFFMSFVTCSLLAIRQQFKEEAKFRSLGILLRKAMEGPWKGEELSHEPV